MGLASRIPPSTDQITIKLDGLSDDPLSGGDEKSVPGTVLEKPTNTVASGGAAAQSLLRGTYNATL